MKRIDPVDVVGAIGILLVAIGIWQFSPASSAIWIGAVMIGAWALGVRIRSSV